jgi:hypothetical protein
MIYLDTPIVIEGVEIHLTEFGLKHKIEHYEHILKIATKEQLSDQARQHIENNLIPRYKLHLKLYGNEQPSREV